MKNVDIIREFARGAERGKCGNLSIIGDKLINYRTVIAERVSDGIRLNTRKYSATTSRIQSLIRNNTNVVATFEGAAL